MSFAHSDRPQCGRSVAYGPSARAAAGAGVVGVLVAVLAAQLDRPGEVLGAVAAAALVLGAAWSLFGPVLRADGEGVAVRGLARTHVVAWADVEQVLVDARRRSAALEIDTGERLLVVPALLLGRVRPAEAAAALAELRPR